MAITAMRKDTWWNKLRIERNIRYKDLAELFGWSTAYWCSAFVGQTMPDELAIKRVCDLFDIDFEQGKEEFRKAHALWHPEEKGSAVLAVTGEHKAKGKRKTSPTLELYPISTLEEACPKNNQSDIDYLELLYGKISYKMFLLVMNDLEEGENPLEALYGRVSYAQYQEILEAVSGNTVSNV